jgi:hypothetical protein
MRRSFFLAISLLAWAAAGWGAPAARVELAYELSRNGMVIAEVLYLLEHDGRSYRITETSKGRGILALRGTIRRTSRGLVSPQGLKPVEFTDERTGRQMARAHFDWEAKTVTQQYKAGPRTEPLSPRAHDRLAFIFDFAFAPSRAAAVEFDLADGRGVSHHVYSPGGQERISTRIGEFQALKFVRAKGTERTEIWLANELSYLPLKILVLDENGTRFEQVATKISAP